ncbi:hypothetical protein M569_09769, partial [Genlisea aurea]
SSSSNTAQSSEMRSSSSFSSCRIQIRVSSNSFVPGDVKPARSRSCPWEKPSIKSGMSRRNGAGWSETPWKKLYRGVLRLRECLSLRMPL